MIGKLGFDSSRGTLIKNRPDEKDKKLVIEGIIKDLIILPTLISLGYPLTITALLIYGRFNYSTILLDTYTR